LELTSHRYPDVAANGDNIAVFNAGNFTRSGGTSASTPIFASIINLINEQRLNAGKNTIGFMNPALYANPSMLNDITTGSNPGCGTIGFPAAPGWDPVTGLGEPLHTHTLSLFLIEDRAISLTQSPLLSGTPNYPKMLEYFMSLP
jgi:tripeptidyl-peptidase-1